MDIQKEYVIDWIEEVFDSVNQANVEDVKIFISSSIKDQGIEDTQSHSLKLSKN